MNSSAAESMATTLVRRLEQACLDWERSWHSGQRQPLESFLGDVGEPDRLLLFQQLLVLEARQRLGSGDAPHVEDYAPRFPEYRELIRIVLERTNSTVAYVADSSQATRNDGQQRAGTETVAAASGTGRPTGVTLDIPGYQVQGELGRGGMGVVWKALQLSLNRPTALKFIRNALTANEQELTRFRAEAELAAQLQHPHIVQIYHVGEHDGQAYLALEYVDGGNLAQKLAGTPQPPHEAARLAETLARAMHFAHTRGIVHRDLKPANVLLTADGVPKVADFGLAKRFDVETGQTQTGAIMGTPSYMAPEQASGKSRASDPRTDVYSLGAILYEMLTGRPPFRGSDMLDTLEQVRTQEPIPPSRLQPKTPPDLETICLKALQKEPERRYADAGALAEDLRRFQAQEPIEARPVGTAERLWRWARRKPRVAALLLVTLVSLAGGVGVSWYFALEATDRANEAESTGELLKKESVEARKNATWAQDEALGALQRAYASDMSLASQAWNAGQPAWALTRLNRYLPQPGKPDVRGFEWYCLSGLARRESQRLQASGVVHKVVFIPSSPLLAFAGADQKIHLYDATTWEWRRTLDGHTGPVYALAASPDGRLLASGSSARWTTSKDSLLRIWDIATGKQLATCEGGGGVRAVAFAPDGKTIAAAHDSTDSVCLWDAETGQRRLTIKCPTNWIDSLLFTPDGKTLITAGYDKTVRAWNAATGQPGPVMKGHAGSVHAVAISPSGQMLASGASDGDVRLWSLPEGKALHVLPLRTEVFGLAFSKDGKMLAVAAAHATLWDVQRQEKIATFQGHLGNVTSLSFDADGRRLASASEDQTVRVWEVPPPPKSVAPGDRTDLLAVAFAPDGATLAVGGHRAVRLLRAADLGDIGLLDGLPGTIRTLLYAPDGKTLFASAGSKTIHRWDAATRAALPPLEDRQKVWAFAITADGKTLASANEDKIVTLWDLATGAVAATLPAHKWSIRDLAFSEDGGMLAVACGDAYNNVAGEIWLWDVHERRHRATLLGHRGPVLGVKFIRSVPAILASASRDSLVKLWDPATGQEVANLEGHTKGVWSLTVSHDGKRLASGSEDQTVRMWDVTTRQEVATLQGHRESVRGLAFSPRDDLLVSASGTILYTGQKPNFKGELRIWDGSPEPPSAASSLARPTRYLDQNVVVPLPGERK